MKEGSLFVLFELTRSTKQGCFRLHSWSLWEALEEKGVQSFGFMVFGHVV
jgi:hypothetical protein